jgi:hypothetical protein
MTTEMKHCHYSFLAALLLLLIATTSEYKKWSAKSRRDIFTSAEGDDKINRYFSLQEQACSAKLTFFVGRGKLCRAIAA